MISQDLVLRLTGLIYDAGANPEGWSAFLTLLADTTRGNGAVIYTDESFRSSRIGATIRTDPAAVKAYEEHYVKVNNLTPMWMDRFQEGHVIPRQVFCPDSEMLKNEYYNDFLRPQGYFHSLTGLIFRHERSLSIIDVFRPYGVDAFDHEEIGLLQELMPHLQRSLELHRRIAMLEQRHKATESAMDLLPLGVVLQDTGAVFSVNARAQAIFAQNDGLRLGSHGLRASMPWEDQRLQTLIAQACETSLGRVHATGGSMAVSRPSMLRAYALLVCPLPPGGWLFGGRTGQAAVFITDPEERVETWDEVARRAFSLTGGEVAVTVQVVQGKTLQQAADELNITIATARTHLHHVFAKTGARRQSDLVRLLLTSPAVMRHTPAGSPAGGH